MSRDNVAGWGAWYSILHLTLHRWCWNWPYDKNLSEDIAPAAMFSASRDKGTDKEKTFTGLGQLHKACGLPAQMAFSVVCSLVLLYLLICIIGIADILEGNRAQPGRFLNLRQGLHLTLHSILCELPKAERGIKSIKLLCRQCHPNLQFRILGYPRLGGRKALKKFDACNALHGWYSNYWHFGFRRTHFQFGKISVHTST